jgi:hypothetical protein
MILIQVFGLNRKCSTFFFRTHQKFWFCSDNLEPLCFRFGIVDLTIQHYGYLQAGCNSFIYQEGDFDPISAISEILSSYPTTAFTHSQHKIGLCDTVS